jgi:hypothetical protein
VFKVFIASAYFDITIRTEPVSANTALYRLRGSR